ncbi:hypothetical protein I4U23_004123 [Adineta vaga]|nr:hypothetical protein I4U23_004123 [Adineta vaga]
MGGKHSTKNKNAEIGKASEFYWACRHGNYEKVRRLIRNMNYEQMCQIEPNGSTALHAATYYGHHKIVELLLEQGCSRTTLNRHGNTPYEEAQTEGMRSIFHRPTSQRFIDEEPSQSFKLKSDSDESDEISEDVPDDWVKGYATTRGAHEANLMHAIARAPLLMRKFLQTRLEADCKESFENFLHETLDEDDPFRIRVISLFNEYKQQRAIEPLFTLYTLETPIYGALQDDCETLTALLYMHLPALRDRAYKGIAYRGARMTHDDIQAYRWTFSQQGRVLETRTLQSMSKKKEKALEFAGKSHSSKSFSVLFIYDFPEVCRTAIDLTKISDTKSALSEFQDEEEVTLLPFTLFKVWDMKTDSNNNKHYRITLRNIPVQKKSIAAAMLNMN